MYIYQTYTEAVPEFECGELITRNSNKSRSGLASLTGIEYENRDANIENRDALIENRDIVIENRVSILDLILDSRFMRGSRIECQLTFEWNCNYCCTYIILVYLKCRIFGQLGCKGLTPKTIVTMPDSLLLFPCWHRNKISLDKVLLSLCNGLHQICECYLLWNWKELYNIFSNLTQFQPRNLHLYVMSVLLNLMDACWWCSEATKMHICKLSMHLV